MTSERNPCHVCMQRMGDPLWLSKFCPLNQTEYQRKKYFHAEEIKARAKEKAEAEKAAEEEASEEKAQKMMPCLLCDLSLAKEELTDDEICENCSLPENACKECGTKFIFVMKSGSHGWWECKDCEDAKRRCRGCKRLFEPDDLIYDHLCETCSPQLTMCPHCKTCTRVFLKKYSDWVCDYCLC